MVSDVNLHPYTAAALSALDEEHALRVAVADEEMAGDSDAGVVGITHNGGG